MFYIFDYKSKTPFSLNKEFKSQIFYNNYGKKQCKKPNIKRVQEAEALFLSAIDEHIERFKRRASNKEKLRYKIKKYGKRRFKKPSRWRTL